MKILLLVHRFPYPPIRGDCIRSWGEVTYLSSRHDVWLACVDREPPAREHLACARGRCRAVAVVVRSELRSRLRGALRLLGGGSLTAGYFYDRRLARIVRRWNRSVGFDAVLTFSPAMAPYAALVQAERRVLDMNDVESARWRDYARRSRWPLNWLYGLEARRLPHAEAAWIRDHQVSLLVNETEQRKLPADLAKWTAVVRTGIDLTRYDELAAQGTGPDLPREPIVGFLGSMSYPPNVRAVNWFGQQVWPLVKQAVPAARWLIVGSRPARSVRRWGELADISVTGFVEDVRPRLRAMRVFTCPAREQIGVQTKLIEAMAAGRAAVVTPQVASGIDYDDPPPFMVASSAREFADAVIRVLRDDAHARSLSKRSRAVATANYSAPTQMRLIEQWLLGETPDEVQAAAPVTLAGAHAPRLVTVGGREPHGP